MGKRYTLPIPFGWYGIAFSDELNVGDVKALHYFGRDLVLFRTESGEAKVLDAYCPHLGAHLGIGGTVKGETIACPFHGWQFNGEGYVEEIPYAEKIPPRADGKQCIRFYPVVELNKAIWCWYHPDDIDPLFEVFRIDELYSDEWDDFIHRDWVVNAAIQETAENAADKAHFAFVHRSQDVPFGEIKHDGYQRHAHLTATSPAMLEDGTLDETGEHWCDFFIDTSNNGPGQTWQRFTGIFDTLMMGLVIPIDDDHIHLRFAFKQKKDQNELQQIMAQGLIDELSGQVEEDIPIWNNKAYRAQPLLCDGDGPISQFRKWFSQFYAEPLVEEEVIKGNEKAPDIEELKNKIMTREINSEQ